MELIDDSVHTEGPLVSFAMRGFSGQLPVNRIFGGFFMPSRTDSVTTSSFGDAVSRISRFLFPSLHLFILTDLQQQVHCIMASSSQISCLTPRDIHEGSLFLRYNGFEYFRHIGVKLNGVSAGFNSYTLHPQFVDE